MAPVNNAVSAVRSAADVRLAREAASVLADTFPRKTRRQISSEVLARLAQKQAERDASGLNHWSEHAPIALKAVIEEIRQEQASLLESHQEFYKANHAKALVYAYAALKDREQAQDAVSATYIELLKGKTTPEFFFHALKSNILDCQRRKKFERGVIETPKRTFNPDRPLAEDQEMGEEIDDFFVDDFSAQIDAQNPFEVLLRQEEMDEALAIATTQRKYRWIKRKNWGKQLELGA